LSWFSNRSIAAKIALCFACVIAIGTATGLFAFLSLSRVQVADDWMIQSYKMRQTLEEIHADVLKQESDVRGYLLGRDLDLLDRTREDQTTLNADVERLRNLIRDHALQGRLATLSNLLSTWRSQLPTAASTRTAGIGAEGILQRILQHLQDIDAGERRLLAQREAARLDALGLGRRWAIIGPLLAVFVALMMGIVLHHVIATPIARLTAAMRRLAQGHTDTTIPNTDWTEQIGEMGRALAVFQTTMIEGQALRAEQQDRTSRMARERSALMTSLADAFEAVVGSIVHSVSGATKGMEMSAASMLDLAQSSTGRVQEVAAATKQASSDMQGVAGETQSLLVSIQEINSRMTRSAAIAEEAVRQADHTSATIGGLSVTAKHIGVVVDLINDVTRQINLLALNATIEAARAGDAGRGFAIVATEVKNLASQTARATEDIRRQIEDIQGAASGSVTAIEQISQTIGAMAHMTADITRAAAAQGEATREMVSGTQATAHATAEVAAQLEQVSDNALTTGKAAMDVLATAKDLAQQTDLLRGEARRFVASVRAG
jgi:methyl-accepting chemotaxis protein